MEFLNLGRIRRSIAKYKYVWIVLMAGIVLMLIPGRSEQLPDESPASQPVQQDVSMEEKLEAILGQLKGAGKVKVMLSVSQGEQIIFQTDNTYSQGERDTDTRTQTILITDHNRNETGLVHQKNPPKYMGAIILSQGAEDPLVKLSIVEAVSKVTGLGADKISVLKME